MSDEAKSRQLLNPATLIAIAIGLVITAMTSAGFLAKYGLIPWTTLIFIAGTVGGVVNSFRRIQKLSLGQIRKQNPMTGPLVTIQIYVSPFVGGVFAIEQKPKGKICIASSPSTAAGSADWSRWPS